MRTGKPNDAKPGEIYISPESMDVLRSLYSPSTDITTGDLPHIRWTDHDGKHYPVTGLGYITKEWAKLFLANWNQAVMLWDKGHLFNDVWSKEEDQKEQIRDQQEYARICCSWIISNGMVEPHCIAEGL